MSILIYKFGGIALSTPTNQKRVINIVCSTQDKVLMVCSAMGRIGFPYSTDSLSKVADNISLKEKDRLLSCGEIISTLKMSHLINNEGKRTYALSPLECGIICDYEYGKGRVQYIENNINELFKEYDVLLVPGFLGVNLDNEVVTLGRGNSDYSAVLLANYLKLKEVVLFKDIDGVYHTSPKVLKRIKKHINLSYDEMILLCDIGFEIVSKDAVDFAKENKINIIVKSFDDENEGTTISSLIGGDLIIGFNVLDKVIKIATFKPCLVQEKLLTLLEEKHIFVQDEKILNNIYSFETNKSVINIVKNCILSLIYELN